MPDGVFPSVEESRKARLETTENDEGPWFRDASNDAPQPTDYSASSSFGSSRHSGTYSIASESVRELPVHSAQSPSETTEAGPPPRHSAQGAVATQSQKLESVDVDSKRLPRGVRLGIDVGKARIGVAGSDPDGLMAMPISTVRRSVPTDVNEIAAIGQERGATTIYVGLPKHMSGKEGDAASDARKFAAQLSAKMPDVELRFIDERLTTVTATANLQAAGRKANRHKSVIDQQAAVIILQSALDAERTSGRRAGTAG